MKSVIFTYSVLCADLLSYLQQLGSASISQLVQDFDKKLGGSTSSA